MSAHECLTTSLPNASTLGVSTYLAGDGTISKAQACNQSESCCLVHLVSLLFFCLVVSSRHQGIGSPVFALDPMPLSDSSTLCYIWVRIPVLRQGVTVFALPPVHHADQGIGCPVFALNPMPLSKSPTPHHIYSPMGEDSGPVPGCDGVCTAPCATYRPRRRMPSVCTEPYAAQRTLYTPPYICAHSAPFHDRCPYDSIGS